MPYEAVIGLEVHAQLKTQTKIFCGCSAAFGAPPNTHVCAVCLGMPGALPVLNRKVVDFALRMALATGCRIARTSRFARKNYFYPDLPKGYQISQYELPIAEHGAVGITVDGENRRIGITRIHMEEDAGKLTHDPDRPVSRVDLNRAGVPLIEIVSEPDLRTPEEAGAYLRKLRTILRYLDISDGNMEEGSFRCDANVSLRPRGRTVLGTRTELKNINSFRFVEKALHYEIQRQREILEDGGQVVQETRLWDDARNRTDAMRGKEEAHDYRYFPDPDLLPLVIDEAWIETLRQDLPELPDQRRQRYVADFGLPDYDAEVLTGARELADYFEACVAAGAAAKPAANWIMGHLLGRLKAENRDFDRIPVPAPALAELLRLIDDGTISGKIAKTVFDEMAESGRTAAAIVAEKGLVQISDTGEIAAVIDGILAANAGQVEAYRAGKTKIFGFFVGQVMKETRGKANPRVVNDLLRQKLDAG
jgi:aspartyl-tRNA(Asn)/glutamyl-tRNA(Gln) amidotransferase subunit B